MRLPHCPATARPHGSSLRSWGKTAPTQGGVQREGACGGTAHQPCDDHAGAGVGSSPAPYKQPTAVVAAWKAWTVHTFLTPRGPRRVLSGGRSQYKVSSILVSLENSSGTPITPLCSSQPAHFSPPHPCDSDQLPWRPPPTSRWFERCDRQRLKEPLQDWLPLSHSQTGGRRSVLSSRHSAQGSPPIPSYTGLPVASFHQAPPLLGGRRTWPC